jgi:hypothetical protein
MRYLLFIFLLIFGANASAQVPTGVPQLFGGKYYEFRSYVLIDSLIMMPCGDTLKIPNKPAIVYNCADSAFYYWNLVHWVKFARALDNYWIGNSTLLRPINNYYVKLQNPSTANTGFSDWPYSTTFNKSALGLYGREPSFDILIDSASQFQIGALTFRSNKLATGGVADKFPRLPASRFSSNAYAVIEANAFRNGSSPWTSTVEIYLGDSTGTNVNVPFAASGPGNHFFGNRTYHTAEAKEALYFGTAINRVSNFTFGSLNTFFAGNLNSLPAYFLNMPRLLTDTTTNKVLVRNPTTGAVNEMFWPTSGTGLTSLNALTASSQTFATGTSGTDFNISSVTSTHTFNIPDASTVNRGLITTGAQSIAGVKTFTGTSTVFGTTGQNANISLRRTSDGAEVGTISVSTNPVFNSGTGFLDLQSGGTTRLRVGTNGVFIGGGSNAAARLELIAGATGANTGALKMNLGSDLTTAVAGVFEYAAVSSVNRLAFTATGTSRRRIPLTSDATPANGQVMIGNGTDFSTANIASSGGSITITNGAGTIDLATTLTLAEGSYTPSAGSSNANLDASTLYETYYYRVGNNVTAWGRFEADPTTTATETIVSFTLPIASNFSAISQLGGVATPSSVTGWATAAARGNTTTDQVEFSFLAGNTSSNIYHFQFSYRIQ